MTGSALDQNLYIYKACHVTFGYNETFCDNLGDDIYDEEEAQVQRRVNDFMLGQSWIKQASSMVYVFFAGALADYFGKKPLIVFPLTGTKNYFQAIKIVALANMFFRHFDNTFFGNRESFLY